MKLPLLLVPASALSTSASKPTRFTSRKHPKVAFWSVSIHWKQLNQSNVFDLYLNNKGSATVEPFFVARFLVVLAGALPG